MIMIYENTVDLERLCFLVSKINFHLRKRDQAFNRMSRAELRKSQGKQYKPRVKCNDPVEYEKHKEKAAQFKLKHKVELKELRRRLNATFDIIAMCPIIRAIKIHDSGNKRIGTLYEKDINEIAKRYEANKAIERMINER